MKVSGFFNLKLPSALVLASLMLSSLTSCYFFRKRSAGSEDESQVSVIGQGLGSKAGNSDSSLLDAVYGTATSYAPAGIRPDPDVFVRSLLLQYREQGATVARQIGRVENYRLLLGGASDDFSVVPQETYDATSLLAKLKVAEEVCLGLVDPNATDHPGWESILPADPSDTSTNITFLIQRVLGTPTSEISSEVKTSLIKILESAQVEGQITKHSYVIVCASLVIDAGSLLL